MPYFKEEQSLGSTKLWISLMTVSLTLVMGIMYGIYYRHISPNVKISDSEYIILATLLLSFIALLDWALLSGKLETYIDHNGIHYRFKPFLWKWKTIKRDQIHEYAIKEHNIYKQSFKRTSFKTNKHLIVSGKQGLFITFANGQEKIIGTNEPKRLKVALKKLLNHSKHA